jgi:hypothetical protein
MENSQIKNSVLLNNRVELALQASDRPLTVHELWEIPDIRMVADHKGKIKDAITGLYNRKKIRRLVYHGPIKSSKKCYEWIREITIPQDVKEKVDRMQQPAKPKSDSNKLLDNLLRENLGLIKTINEWETKSAVTKPNVHVGKDSITIESDKFRITIEI